VGNPVILISSSPFFPPISASFFCRNHNCADHDHHQHPPHLPDAIPLAIEGGRE